MTRRPLSAVADRATRLRRRLRHVASERGETLIESLVSIGIVGIVVVALIGAVTLSGSLTTILRAQSESQMAGGAVAQAVSSYRAPKAWSLTVLGTNNQRQCNSKLTDLTTSPIMKVARDSVAGNTNVSLDEAGTKFFVAVQGSNYSFTMYSCNPLDTKDCQLPEDPANPVDKRTPFGGPLLNHPDASAGESEQYLEVCLPVTAQGHTTVSLGNGQVNRQDATFPAQVQALVQRGVR